MLLMIKIHCKLPYRMLEGFTKYVLSGMKLPTYSLTCKRASKLRLMLPKWTATRPHTIIVDSSGIKVLGEGEWKVKVHGKGRPRKWIKLHLAIDANTQEIVNDRAIVVWLSWRQPFLATRSCSEKRHSRELMSVKWLRIDWNVFWWTKWWGRLLNNMELVAGCAFKNLCGKGIFQHSLALTSLYGTKNNFTTITT